MISQGSRNDRKMDEDEIEVGIIHKREVRRELDRGKRDGLETKQSIDKNKAKV
jgi:hypothetical protein